MENKFFKVKKSTEGQTKILEEVKSNIDKFTTKKLIIEKNDDGNLYVKKSRINKIIGSKKVGESKCKKFWKNCCLCPRKCNINRKNGRIGKCKATNKIKVALYSIHRFEEPCISGEKRLRNSLFLIAI